MNVLALPSQILEVSTVIGARIASSDRNTNCLPGIRMTEQQERILEIIIAKLSNGTRILQSFTEILGCHTPYTSAKSVFED